jgi:transcriptional regulator with XRE-family HTH domain
MIDAVESGYNTALGARIARARKAKHLTQAALSRAVGTTSSSIGYYESGAYRCPPFWLARIAVALGVPVSDLLTDIMAPACNEKKA